VAQVILATDQTENYTGTHQFPKMASQWFSCRGACSHSDPVADTVKVDVSKLAFGKENMQPLQARSKAEQAQKEQAQKQRAQEELRRQQQKEAEERRRAEEQARQRREKEEAERRRLEQAAAERAAAERASAEAEEQLRMEAEKAAEEKAGQEHEAAEFMEAQKAEDERLAREKVNSWCKANGFGDMNSQKKSFMSGSRFPLHEAVAKNNEEMVGLMVQLGADKEFKNSKGQTAEDIARKMNKGGSMDSILAKLSASQGCCPFRVS